MIIFSYSYQSFITDDAHCRLKSSLFLLVYSADIVVLFYRDMMAIDKFIKYMYSVDQKEWVVLGIGMV